MTTGAGPLDATPPDATPLDGGLGIIGWNQTLDGVFLGLEKALDAHGRRPGMAVMRFPPVIARKVLVASEFAVSFPQLFGAVHALDADAAALRRRVAQAQDGLPELAPTEFVLTPAACYPVYPRYSGQLSADGAMIDVYGWCFRHEPSTEPGRLVAFRQREFVRIGDRRAAVDWFTGAQRTALEFVDSLGLEASLDIATDPFFGPGGRLLAAGQREERLKFEVLAPIDGAQVAVASCNYHRDHFGTRFGIGLPDGSPAHTACIGFGMERLALALVSRHGPDPARWPAPARRLWAG